MTPENKKRFDTYVSDVNTFLDSYLMQFSQDEDYLILHDAMRYSVENGGKRIRPVLVLEFSRMCGGEYNEAYNFAAALEMIHTYSLIHDDLPCMDNDDMRRGKPSCHKKFGEAYALLAGDGLLTAAFQCIASSELPATCRIKAVEVLARAAGPDGMVAGQAIDLLNEDRNPDISVIEKTDSYKTGCLLKAACVLGCIAANAEKEQYEAARDYADNMGLAFQIQDDILDATSTTEKLGKPALSDIDNGKSTYVRLLGLDQAREMVDVLSAKAKQALAPFGKEAAFLIDLTDFLADREN
jgi:geranylgeranyl diphosphate synthase type II